MQPALSEPRLGVLAASVGDFLCRLVAPSLVGLTCCVSRCFFPYLSPPTHPPATLPFVRAPVTCSSVRLSLHPSPIHLSIHRPFTRPSVHLSVHPPSLPTRTSVGWPHEVARSQPPWSGSSAMGRGG